MSALYCDSPDEPQAPYVELQDIHIVQGAETDLIVGGELQLQVSAEPIHATNKDYQYTTTQKGVATVSESGLVKAVGKGIATITGFRHRRRKNRDKNNRGQRVGTAGKDGGISDRG